MMRSAAFRIRLGQDDPVPGDLVDGADMLAVASDHGHMLADLTEKPALVLPLLAPASEVVLELRLMLAAEVVIVAVELAHVAVAPARIMRVEVAILPGRTGEAGAAIIVARPRAFRAVGLAAEAAEAALAALMAAGGEELPGFMIAAAIVAGHRAIAAAFAVAASREIAAPPLIIVALARSAAVERPAIIVGFTIRAIAALAEARSVAIEVTAMVPVG